MICAKKQESITHNRKKEQSIKNVPEEFQILDLLYKDFKPVIKNIVIGLKKSMC